MIHGLTSPEEKNPRTYNPLHLKSRDHILSIMRGGCNGCICLRAAEGLGSWSRIWTANSIASAQEERNAHQHYFPRKVSSSQMTPAQGLPTTSSLKVFLCAKQNPKFRILMWEERLFWVPTQKLFVFCTWPGYYNNTKGFWNRNHTLGCLFCCHYLCYSHKQKRDHSSYSAQSPIILGSPEGFSKCLSYGPQNMTQFPIQMQNKTPTPVW